MLNILTGLSVMFIVYSIICFIGAIRESIDEWYGYNFFDFDNFISGIVGILIGILISAIGVVIVISSYGLGKLLLEAF